MGASLSGVRTAQALRQCGYQGAITLVGDEPHLPYDKPPLSKEMLSGSGDPVPLLLEEDARELQVELRLGARAVALDPSGKRIELRDGESLSYDHLVIATGVSPRTLPGAEEMDRVFTVRTLDDVTGLREALADPGRLVVVGAGFIGAEVASAARGLGWEVDIVEPQSIPMSHVFGPEVGQRLASMHEANGAHLHSDVGVAELLGDGRVQGVRLTDGRSLDADLVVVGIGATPCTDWLLDSGLVIEDGVVCDEGLRAVGVEDVYAVGDVARWPSPYAPGLVRIEHWTNAQEHGALVAASIAGAAPPPTQPPYVWSDQYGQRIQVVGIPRFAELASFFDGDGEGPAYALYRDSEGVCTAAVVLNDPRVFMRIRRAVAAGQRVEDVDLPIPTV